MQSMHDSDSGERVANPGWADSWNRYRFVVNSDNGSETLTVTVLPVQPEEALVTLRIESEGGDMELIDITPEETAYLAKMLTILAADLQRQAYDR